MPTDAAPLTDEVRAVCVGFVGRMSATEDSLAPEPAGKLAALFGAPVPVAALPPTWHWAYFNSPIAPAEFGADLHERTGLFLPPVPLPRRMWAAGEVTIHRPLRLGTPAHRISTVAEVAFKAGASGQLCFVTVAHRISQQGELCIAERQTIVYRGRGAPERELRRPDDPVPDGFFTHPEAQLWCYSAVTHNAHRIHWDRAWCRDVEGYPDLVVHGPLMASELCNAMHDGEGPLRFTFRAQAPVFVTSPVRILPGEPGPVREGRIERSDGVVSMLATLAPV
jgi:3-methylfumaryl-CoA hydratase